MKLQQTGTVSLLVIALLVVGVIVGLILVINGTGFLPSAQENYSVQTQDSPDVSSGEGGAQNTYIDR
jgi:hypothetical protein